MPVVAYNDFISQIQMLNYEQSLSVMQLVLNQMKKLNESNSERVVSEMTSDAEKISKINATLAKIPKSEQLEYCDVGIESVREALKNDSW